MRIFLQRKGWNWNRKNNCLWKKHRGIYPEWNEMTDISLMEAMFSLQEEERKLIYQHVFEERTFKEMSILNQMTEERCVKVHIIGLSAKYEREWEERNHEF